MVYILVIHPLRAKLRQANLAVKATGNNVQRAPYNFYNMENS